MDDLQAQIKAASQDALSLNAALSRAQAELSRAVAQRDQSRREYARYREGHARGAFSDQMVDTRLQTWKADEASVSAAQAKVVQARNALDSVVKGKNTTVASLLAQLQRRSFSWRTPSSAPRRMAMSVPSAYGRVPCPLRWG